MAFIHHYIKNFIQTDEILKEVVNSGWIRFNQAFIKGLLRVLDSYTPYLYTCFISHFVVLLTNEALIQRH